MEAIDFVMVRPHEAESLPKEALEFLNSLNGIAISCEFTTEDIIRKTKEEKGYLFLIKIRGEIFGIFYFIFKSPENIYLDIQVLAGKKMPLWKDSFMAFVKNLMRNAGCEEVWITGRKGFEKVFPELKPVGTIYVGRLRG